LESPAVVGFCGWLGVRATEIDWTSSVARETTDVVRAGRRIVTADITPVCPPSMLVEVFILVGADTVGEAVVVAVVDGATVVASSKGVSTAIDLRSQRLANAAENLSRSADQAARTERPLPAPP
jgi:hypothetical protein